MNADKLAEAIETVDNLAHALQLPMSAEFHIGILRESLPEAVADLKAEFAEVTGENPWE
jgi:hypothetical protein